MHKRYAGPWAELQHALNDTSVSRDDYIDALVDMVDDLEPRLAAAREERELEEEEAG